MPLFTDPFRLSNDAAPTLAADLDANGKSIATVDKFTLSQTTTSGVGASFTRDLAAASTDSALVTMTQAHVDDDQNVLSITQDGTAGSCYGLVIDATQDNTNNAAALIEHSSEGALTNFVSLCFGGDASRRTAFFKRNITAAATAKPVVEMQQSHASDDQPLLQLTQASTADALFIDHNNSGASIEIDQDINDANACYGMKMNIANAGAGLEYAFKCDGSEVVAAGVGGAQDKKIRIDIGGTDYFIPCHTA
jgi:hypothetical protein|tara:strand:+ start:13574 stop:14326 length:753 start_codon:yes stop_codon:yes gene_type:complete